MGALCGFTGTPDAHLLAVMRDALTHRGRQFLSRETDYGTVGLWTPFDDGPREVRGSGIFETAGRLVGVAGHRPLPAIHAAATDAERIADSLDPDAATASGDFVACILDAGGATLVRDAAGVRSIYHATHAGRLFFSSEPKAIWGIPGFPRRLSVPALAQYLTFSFVPGRGTMLRDVFSLPAGHLLRWTPDGAGPGKERLQRYFFFERPGNDGNEDFPEPAERSGADRADAISDGAWVERFRQVFSDAVAERLPENGPAAVFLSGGLDSSIVAAEVAQQTARRTDRRVPTYALHFGAEYPNELPFAAAVARRCGTDHTEVLIRPRDFLPRLRRMVWHLDDPIGDPITMPNFELASRVSDTTRWVFNGEGGDPCFGGPKNIPMLLEHFYGGLTRGPRFREQAYLASYRRGYEELARLLTPEARSELDEARDLDGVLTPFFERDQPPLFLDKLAAINVRLKGAELILPKVERMLSASGVTSLSPLFTGAMVRFSFQLPPRMKLRAGVEKIVLKRAYEDFLPAEVIRRPKSGMRVPVHFWFRGELKRFARKILSRRELSRVGLFDPDRVQQLLNYRTEEGPGRYGIRLWMLVTFEIWRRIVLEGESV